MLKRILRGIVFTAGMISMGASASAEGSAVASTKSDWGYDTVVAPVDRPAWLEKVVVVQESLWADEGRTVLKPRIKALQAAGFEVLAMYPHAFCGLWEPGPGENWMQACHDEVKAAHAAGVRVLAGCYPYVGAVGARDLLEKHPEWRLRRTDADPEGPGEGCLISPFGDAMIERLALRMREYDVDGFQFDGWYQDGFCRCQSCRKLYPQETGCEVPPKRDVTNPAYLHYLVWRDKKLFEQFVKLQKAIRAVKPDGVLINWNRPWPIGSYPSEMPYALNAQNDWTNKEFWDHFESMSTWEEKLLRGSSGDRPVGIQPYMFMRPGLDNVEGGMYHGSSCPIEEVLYRANEILAMGSIPMIWSGARPGWTESDSDAVNQMLIDYLPWVHGTRSYKYAACLDSYSTTEMSRVEANFDVWLPNARAGLARLLAEEHIPFDVLSEHNVTPELLREYKVVILPDNFCMSERVTKVLREYVSSGGGLVANFEASLYDEYGGRRAQFALGDLFGATWRDSSLKEVLSLVSVTEEKHVVSDDPGIRDLMGRGGRATYFGRYANVERTAGAVMPLSGVTVTNKKLPEAKSWVPILLNEFKAGRVAYFPAAICETYYESGYPYQRKLFDNAVRWAAKSGPAVSVRAPMCVQAGYFEKDDAAAHRVVVHLLNEINSTTGHGSANEKRQAIREEVVPISDVRVLFRGEKPNRVYLIPGKIMVTPVETEAGWEVTVPKLAVHAVVVSEWDKPAK